MFAEGQLLRFDPFIFKKDVPSKPKYYVVLKHMGDDIMMASLPTSKDHIPGDLSNGTGCINFPERGINAFVFAAGQQVTDKFSFPLRTYIYGEQVDEYSQQYLDSMASRITDLGIISVTTLAAIRNCVKHSPLIKRKYAKIL